jgi:hypothetical protein
MVSSVSVSGLCNSEDGFGCLYHGIRHVRTLSPGVRAFDWRRSRYRGLAKTPLQHILMATAINLVRVVAWLTDPRA